MNRYRKGFLITAFAFLISLGTFVGLSLDRNSKINEPKQALAEDLDYTFRVFNENEIEIYLNRDCSIDINKVLKEETRNYDMRLILYLNNHTLTITSNTTIQTDNYLKIEDGTVICDGDHVIFQHSGQFKFTNLTLKANCVSFLEVNDKTTYSSSEIRNCNFNDCTFTGSYGGVLYFHSTNSKGIQSYNNYFYNCTSNGALFYINDIGSKWSSESNRPLFDLEGCRFYNCTNKYGCIYLNSPYIDVGDFTGNAPNSIDSCTSTGYGGGIYDGDSGGFGTIKGFIFSNNKSEGYYGGAMYLAADGRIVENCTFYNNSATSDGYGGAIYFEEDYLKVIKCQFLENEAYKGGAIYNNGWTNELIDSLFVYNKAYYGWGNDVRLPTHAVNCHFYNTDADHIFDDYWSDYYGYSGYVEASCSANDSNYFLYFTSPAEGTLEDPYIIDSQETIFRLYVNSKFNINSFLASAYYTVAKENFIWFAPIPNFNGYINGENAHIFAQGNTTSLVLSGEAKYYILENHSGEVRHETPTTVSYYVYNELTGQMEQKTSEVNYLFGHTTQNDIRSGFYYINKDITFSERVNNYGDVHLIIADGVTFKAEKGIHLNKSDSLSVYAQTKDNAKAGKLIAIGKDFYSAIGGNLGGKNQEGETCGSLTVNGVTIEIPSSEAAGIGGGNAGNVYNQLGPGFKGGNGGDIKIYKSTVTINSNGTGIGGGMGGQRNGSSNLHGDGGDGGKLTLVNTNLSVHSATIGIGGGETNHYGYSNAWAKDGLGVELSIKGGYTQVLSDVDKAIILYKPDDENYLNKVPDFIENLILGKYGNSEQSLSSFNIFNGNTYANAKCVVLTEHKHDYVENGHNIICKDCGHMISFGNTIDTSISDGVITLKLLNNRTSGLILNEKIHYESGNTLVQDKIVLDLNGFTWNVTGSESFGYNFKNIAIKNGTMTFNNPDCTPFVIEDGLQIDNVTFKDCNTQRLFKITSRLNEQNSMPFEVKNCNFLNCSFSENGGIFYFDQTKESGYYRERYVIENSLFYNLKTTKDGSVFYVNELKSSNAKLPPIVDVRSCNFINCSANGNGGVAYFNDDVYFGNYYNLNEEPTTKNYSSLDQFLVGPQILANVFTGCKATNGAAIYSNTDKSYIELCTFAFNEATNNGGAIYLTNQSELDYVLFARNSAISGTGIYATNNQYKIDHYYLFMDSWNTLGNPKYIIEYEGDNGYYSKVDFKGNYDIPGEGTTFNPYHIDNAFDLIKLSIICYREANGYQDTSYRKAYYSLGSYDLEALVPLDYFEGQFINTRYDDSIITNRFVGNLLPRSTQVDNDILIYDIIGNQYTPVIVHEKTYDCTHDGHATYYEVAGKFYSDETLEHEITNLNAWTKKGGEGYVTARHEDKNHNGLCDLCNKQYGYYYSNETRDFVIVTDWTPGTNNGIITEDTTELFAGWYFLINNTTINERLQIHGNVKIVIGEGVEAKFNKGINLSDGNILTFYSQVKEAEKMGKLFVTSNNANAAIGSSTSAGDNGCGELVMEGGNVSVTAGASGVAFGGASKNDKQGNAGGTLKFNNGILELNGGFAMGGGKGTSRGDNGLLETASTMKVFDIDGNEVTDNLLVNNMQYAKIYHVHGNWKYTTSGNTLTARCSLDDCTVSITTNAEPVYVYTGKPVDIEIYNVEEFIETTGVDSLEIFYTNTSTALPSAPTDVGTYTLCIKLSDNVKVNCLFRITKADISGYSKEVTALLPPLVNSSLEVTLPEIPEGFEYVEIINENENLYEVSDINKNKITLTAKIAFESSAETTTFSIRVHGDRNYNYYYIIVTVIPDGHIHGNWTYTVDGNVVTATCGNDDCSETPYSVSLALSAENKRYDGDLASASHNDLETMFSIITKAEIGEIEYFLKDYKLLEAPTDVGTYVAQLQIKYNTSETLTISKEFTIEKAITVITINAVETEKYYDGKCIVLPTVTSNYGEIFTVGSGSFANAGVYKLVYSVVEGPNYTGAQETIALRILSREITVTIFDQYSEYGDDIGEFYYEYEGLVDGDNIEDLFTIESEVTKYSDVGTYDIVGVTKNNTTARNYEISYEGQDGGIYGHYFITKGRSEISVDTTTITKTYGEEIVLPTATSNFGEVVCDTLESDLVNAGEYIVTYTILETQNYLGDIKTLKVIIEQKEVDISWLTLTDDELVYSGEEKILSAVINEGLVGDDACSVLTELAPLSDNINVGSFTYTISGLSNKNYIYKGSLISPTYTITKAHLTITANDEVVSFGDEPVGSVTYEGFVNNETEEVLEGELVFDFGDYVKGKIGQFEDTFVITPSGLSSNNYEITFVYGSLNVVKKDISKEGTDIEITYDKRKSYNGVTQTFEVTSVKVGDYVLEQGVDYVISNNTAKDVNFEGSYNLEITGINNYTGSVYRVFYIEPVVIEILWEAPSNLAYDGKAKTPTATADPSSVFGEDVCTLTIELVSGGNILPGSFMFEVTGISNSNYLLPEDLLSPEYTITKAKLVVTANDITITFNEDANGSVTYNGFAEGETEDVLDGELVLDYGDFEKGKAGQGGKNFIITPSGLTADNYEIEFVKGLLVVEKKDISKEGTIIELVYQDKKTYNGETQTFDITSLKVDGTLLVKDKDFVISNNTAKDVAVGAKYNLMINGINDYAGFLFKEFSIEPVEVDIVWTAPENLTYTGQAKAPTVNVKPESLIGNDTCFVIAELTDGKDNVNAGTFTFTAKGLSNSNYKLKGNLTSPEYVITKAHNEITILALESWNYGETPSTPEVSAKFGEVELLFSKVSPRDFGMSELPVEAGTYIVKAFVIGNKNYENAEKELQFSIIFVSKDKNGNPISNPKVSITETSNGAVPEGAILVIDEVDVNNKKATSESTQALKENGKLAKDEKIFGIYDVELLVNETAVQPNGNIKFKMKLPNELIGKEFKIYHIHNEGETVEVFEITNVSIDEEGYITFETDKLSQFAFIAVDPTYKPSSNTLYIALAVSISVIVLAGVGVGVFFIVKKSKSKKK